MKQDKVMKYLKKKGVEDKIFEILFVTCSKDYIHPKEQLEWGKEHVTNKMNEMDDIICAYYDELINLPCTMELIQRDLIKVKEIRDIYFEAKKRALANGVNFTDEGGKINGI
jgi:hypothetical protein